MGPHASEQPNSGPGIVADADRTKVDDFRGHLSRTAARARLPIDKRGHRLNDITWVKRATLRLLQSAIRSERSTHHLQLALRFKHGDPFLQVRVFERSSAQDRHIAGRRALRLTEHMLEEDLCRTAIATNRPPTSAPATFSTSSGVTQVSKRDRSRCTRFARGLAPSCLSIARGETPIRVPPASVSRILARQDVLLQPESRLQNHPTQVAWLHALAS